MQPFARSSPNKRLGGSLKRTSFNNWAWRSAVTAATVVIAVGVVQSPAHASVAQGSVYGSGTVTDDWGDEGPLSTTKNRHNSVVGLWQGVLIADGYLPASGLDCDFGPNTRAATIAWQSDRGLKADGEVGPQSFGRADNNLFWNGSEIRYNGSNSDLGSMYRNSAGRWYIAGSSSIVYVSYTDDSLCD